MKIVIQIAFGIYLLVLAVIDIKNKKLPITVLLAGVIFVPAFMLVCSEMGLRHHIFGLIPGVVFFLISFVSRGQVGSADCLIILLSGACLGIGMIVVMLSVAFVSIALTSLMMLAARKLNRKSTLPFIPFIFLGYIVSVWVF